MKAGLESQTAVMVAVGRALADGAESEFRDPTAYTLLPDEARRRVDAIKANQRPRRWRDRMMNEFRKKQALVTIARTVAIDRVVREAGAAQVVILGAGLDGRAWRMLELRDAVVFEVDHPDSQRAKQARAAALTPAAREIRFVPVDFQRDRLDEALARAGHDTAMPTTWIWEGVVMYLTPADVEATLAILAARSAPGSRLVILYHAPALIRHLIGLLVRRMGEPLRSAFTAADMRALLGRHGFGVVRDDDLSVVGAAMSPAIRETTRRAAHMRIVVGERGR